MPTRAMTRNALATAALVCSLPILAQTADFDVLVDTDRSPATGCSTTSSGGATLDGFEHRIRASVDLASLEVVALEQSSCAGGSFGAPVAIAGFPVPYPLALNTGTGGADAVELAVARAALGATNLSQLQLTFATDNGSGSDVLATADGSAGGGPIVFGLPVQIPVMSISGLGILVFVLLGLAWMAQRRMGRVGAVMAVMLVATAAWAMTFAVDGSLSDWGSRAPNATDPGGDATDGSSTIDLVAGFVVLDGGNLFFRMDVSDTENEAPTAADDAYSTDEDTPLNVAAPGVLANDSDVELDPISAVLDTGPADAQSFTLNPDGSFEYTPNPDFNGTDSFRYFANDGQADSAAATVTITVNATNDTPIADAQAAETDEDVPVVVTLTGSDVDGDALTFTVDSAPGNGSLGAITPIDSTSAQVTYTPDPDFNGGDGFTFTVNDGTVDSAPAAVSLTVNPVNDPPSAIDGLATTEEDIPVAITLSGSDIDGDALTFAIAGGPANGTLGAVTQLTPTTAEVTYTPTAGFSGPDSFTFTADDGTVASTAATISITVTPGNAPPVANDAMAATDEDSPVVITLTGSDADGDPLTFAIAAGPGNGSLGAITPIDSTSAQVTYTPNANFFGSDSFAFTANDGTETSTAATVSLTVNAINDAPTVVDHALTTHSAIRITLGAGDSELLKDGATDVDDSSAALSVSPLPATSVNGAVLTLVDSDTGTYRYDPPGGFTGADSFEYEVCDSATTALPVLCATATVNVTVTGPALWVIDPAAAAGGDGSLNRPFQVLSSLPGGRTAGGRIFLASGNNGGGHAFVADEHLIGQGATGNTFDGFLAVQIPANGTLDTRPAVGGARPIVQGQVALGNGITTQGFNIAPAAGTQGLTGSGALTGIDVSQINVATSNAPAVSLNGVTGSFTLDRVDANGGANGIVLVNTNTASGSFSVTGDAGSTQNGSGGLLTNLTGNAVQLTDTRNVSLDQLNMSNIADNGILGVRVNGLSVLNATFTSIGDANGEDVFSFDRDTLGDNGLVGTALFQNLVITSFAERAIDIVNEGAGTLDLDVIDISASDNNDTFGEDAIRVQTEGTVNADVLVSGGTYDNLELDVLAYFAQGTGTHTVEVTDVTSTNGGGPDNFPNGGGVAIIGSGGSTTSFDINTNSLTGVQGDVIQVVGLAGAGQSLTMNGVVGNNILSSDNADGIDLDFDGDPGGGSAIGGTLLVQNNSISFDDDGIGIDHRDAAGTMNVTIANNTLSGIAGDDGVTTDIDDGIFVFTDDDVSAAVNQLNVEMIDNQINNVAAGNNVIEIVDVRDGNRLCFAATGTSIGSGGGSIEVDTDAAADLVVDATSAANLSTLNNGIPVNEVVAPTYNSAVDCIP